MIIRLVLRPPPSPQHTQIFWMLCQLPRYLFVSAIGLIWFWSLWVEATNPVIVRLNFRFSNKFRDLQFVDLNTESGYRFNGYSNSSLCCDKISFITAVQRDKIKTVELGKSHGSKIENIQIDHVIWSKLKGEHPHSNLIENTTLCFIKSSLQNILHQTTKKRRFSLPIRW